MEGTYTRIDESRCTPVGKLTAEMVREKMPGGVLRHVGVDLSKQKCSICFISADGKLKEMEHPLGSGSRESLYGLFHPGDLVIMETSTGTFDIAREMNRLEGVVACVVDPKTTHLDKSKKKTDREDAYQLSRLILRNPLEELFLVSIPNDKEMEDRQVMSLVDYYGDLHVMTMNRLTSLFHDAGFPEAGKGRKLHTKEGRASAIEECFGDDRNLSAQKWMSKDLDRTLTHIEETIEREKKKVVAIAKENKTNAAILGSIPGVGTMTIAAINAFVGDISRFASSKQLCSYCGLAPRVFQSGQRDAKRRISKEGQAILRKCLVQCAYAMPRVSCDFKLKGKLKDFKGRMPGRKAAIAIARKLVCVMYSMLKNGTLFSSDDEEEKKGIETYQQRKILEDMGSYNKNIKSCRRFSELTNHTNSIDWKKLGICAVGD